MTHTYSCRWPYLAEILAAFEVADLSGQPCDQPAVWATSVNRERDGQDVETVTRLCRHHDDRARELPGHVGSTSLIPL
jgi:hypothetical protein